jgi:inorganic phosphate transporter, PiT family
METVGNAITDLPVEAVLVVELVSATIVTGLSWNSIPASLAVTATMCVIGLGWCRASRQVPLESTVRPDSRADVVNCWEEDRLHLYDKGVTKRVVSAWFATPLFAGIAAFVVFTVASGIF